MLRVPIPYVIDASAKLTVRQLHWPSRCACCGDPNPSAGAALSRTVRETRSQAGNTATTSGYYLGWSVPYCETCLRHQAQAVNPLSLPVLVVAGIAILFVVGYALFAAGYSEDPLTIAGYVAFIVLLALGGYGLSRWMGAARLRQAGQLTNSGCAAVGPAVSVTSDMQHISFDFHNDGYARDFAALNAA